VMTQIIQRLPDNSRVALRVYGHRIAPGKVGACQDSELMVPFAKIDKPRLIERVRLIRALGTTPIAYSLARVADDFGNVPGEKMILLVTDGIEECRGNPSAAVSELLAKGLEVRVNVVGFAFADNASKMEMQRIAELSRGRFFDAKDVRELRDAIQGALAVPFDVLDDSNVSVGTGLVGRAAISVPEGTYKILLHVPDASNDHSRRSHCQRQDHDCRAREETGQARNSRLRTFIICGASKNSELSVRLTWIAPTRITRRIAS